MRNFSQNLFNQLFTFRWKPNRDLLIVMVSWLLVVGSLSMATFVVGQKTWGGMGYFIFYALIGATLCGVGIPLYWTVIVNKRPISDLGITSKHLKTSIILQIIFTVVINIPRLLQINTMGFKQLFPLIWMSLAIGFFEAIFWRGWVQQRFEESFGLIPSILVGSGLYSIYHIGYGMPASELLFLFIIGLMFAFIFRITKNIFILWPLFQPGGQLITLITDQLSLPILAFMGFLEVLVLMLLMVWLAARIHKKRLIGKIAIMNSTN